MLSRFESSPPPLEPPWPALSLPMKLVLFDIDGTLITDRGAARDAFTQSLQEVYGYRGDATRFDFSGRTDPQIARMVLAAEGFGSAEIERGLEALWHHYLRALETNLAGGGSQALPGIEPLVDALDAHEGVVLGLLTGNIEPGARLKLAGPDLNRYFPFGAFGSDSADREKLPPIAVARARSQSGHVFATRDVVIIGDSIFDVRCGVPHGATTVAVASGRTPASTLRAENPTHLFESAEEWERIVEVVAG